MTSPEGKWPLSAALTSEITEEFEHFKIVPKVESPFCKVLDLALRLVTAGAQDRFMSHYHTVIGYTLYVPERWALTTDVQRVILLRHERVHLRQRRRYGFLPFAFLYLVPILPLGLAYGRARLEWEAYRETLIATLELLGPEALHNNALRQEIVRRFTSGDYGWMWPFPSTVGRWFDAAVEELTRAGPG